MERSDGREKPRDAIAGIGSGVMVTGDVTCTGELQIDGKVKGEVRCTTLFLSEGGLVEGSIHVERARLSGTVDGAVNAGDLAVEQSAHVKGDVTYARLKVATGAVIEGSMKHRAIEEGAVETGGLKLVEPARTAAAPAPGSSASSSSAASPTSSAAASSASSAAPTSAMPPSPVTPPQPRRVYVD